MHLSAKGTRSARSHFQSHAARRHEITRMMIAWSHDQCVNIRSLHVKPLAWAMESSSFRIAIGGTTRYF